MEYEVLGSRLHNPASGQYPEPVYSTHNPTTPLTLLQTLYCLSN